MARVPHFETIANGEGQPIASGTIDVRHKADNSLATLYAAETGGTTKDNPLDIEAADEGLAAFWIDEGLYDITVTSGGSSETYTRWIAKAPVRFTTVAAMVADTRPSLGLTGQDVYANGYRYTIQSGASDLQTAGGVNLKIEPFQGAYHIKQWNINNDGTTDDSASVQAALDKWEAEIAADTGVNTLRFGGTNLKIDTSLNVAIATNMIAASELDFSGGTIISGVTSTGNGAVLQFTTTSHLMRNFYLRRPSIKMGGSETRGILVLAGTTGATSFYRFIIDNPIIKDTPASAKALEFRDNTFECVVLYPNLDCDATSGGTYCMHVTNAGGGNVTSVEVYGGTMFGGINNLRVDQGGVKVFGCTFLDAGSYAVDAGTGTSATTEMTLIGCRFERAQMDGVDDHAVYIKGQATITGCYSTSDNGNLTKMIRARPTSGGIRAYGNMISATLTGGVIEIDAPVSDGLVFTDALPSEITWANADDQDNVVAPGKLAVADLGDTSGAVTHSMDNGNVLILTATGAVTINAPTSPIEGQELHIYLVQDGTGSHSVTFNAIFTNVTAATTTAGQKNYWKFVHLRGGWRETAHETFA